MQTLAQVLYDSYLETPERTALYLLYSRLPDQPLTWQQLISGAAGYASAYAGAGVRPGEIVILILPHGEDLLSAFIGAVLHGAIPSILPFLTEKLSPQHYQEALKALFASVAPAAVVTYSEFQAQVEHAAVNAPSIRALLASGAISPQKPEAEKLPGLGRPAREIVLLQHSSGTTGLQKGVALSHEAVFNQLQSYSAALHLEPADVIASWLPLYHDMGLIAGFLLPLLTRTPLVLMSPFDWVRAPYRLMQAVSHYKATLAWLPNFAYNFCAQKIRDRDLEGVDLSSWRAVINCSEPMYLHSHELFLERFAPYGLRPGALATCYAMAENVFAVTQGGIDSPVRVDTVDLGCLLNEGRAQPAAAEAARETEPGPKTARLLSAGRPVSNTRVKVVDDQGSLLPERQIGEIALQSDCMLTGYYNRPDLTEKAFRDGWYLTGDLGYLAEGELYITGRKKDLIIVGGKNIYPQDLERLAGEVEGIHPGRTVAFGVLNEAAGTEEVVVVAEADTGLEEERLRLAEEVRLRINSGSDIVVRQVAVVERGWLLKTSSGKIARSANRDKYLAK
jgi:acyl-CoA synthetase (AMP-forming)/AMP-acid ligase II